MIEKLKTREHQTMIWKDGKEDIISKDYDNKEIREKINEIIDRINT